MEDKLTMAQASHLVVSALENLAGKKYGVDGYEKFNWIYQYLRDVNDPTEFATALLIELNVLGIGLS